MALSFFSQVILGFCISEPRPYDPQNKMTFDPTRAVVSRGRRVKFGSIPWNPSSISEKEFRKNLLLYTLFQTAFFEI